MRQTISLGPIDPWAKVWTATGTSPQPSSKPNCLRLVDEVTRQRRPIVITKRGKPIAKIAPVEGKPIDLFGCMAGTAEIRGDTVDPIEDAGWTGNEENI